MNGIGGHQRTKGRSDEWLTPREIVEALGPFDLDPCSPILRPWDTADVHYDLNDDGLSKPWKGRVWLNPPYGLGTPKWLERLADHGDGIALVFARTETEFFHRLIWERAEALLFLRGRLRFCTVTGEIGKENAGGPSVLVAYGASNAARLSTCGIAGHGVLPRGFPKGARLVNKS